jgi:NAD(P)-dependent dehydrogenase (short-subunit alcohol dehydrogenase family)
MKAEDVEACLRVLRAIAGDRALLAAIDEETRHALLEAAGVVSRPARHERRRLAKAFRRRDEDRRRAHDARLVAATLNRTARRHSDHVLPASTVPHTPLLAAAANDEELLRPRTCYICKVDYRRVHAFYDSLCPACAELNHQKRFQTARLDGRVALVTGARIKIGYQASLMLLRAGCEVHATTRFPNDAARRYAREPDFDAFRARLHVYGLDLVHAPTVERFAAHLCDKLPHLDFLINNAAQTVRRPPAFYRHLVEAELAALPAPAAMVRANDVLAARDDAHFPPGRLDLDEQQLDLRAVNSWRLTLAEVDAVELLEVHLVNAIAPFLLNARLKPLLAKRGTRDAHIVNVSAMEAQFARNKKTDKHPHTNMAKAALNMMTRTSAVDYVRDGIHMNSVDTGWVTDEDPLPHVARKQEEHDFHPPLDAVDGAARVLDPIFTGFLTGQHPWGLFLKDYKPVPW